MIKVEQRKREREIFVNNTYISPIPTSVLAPLLPFPSFPLIFARPFIHFLSFSLLIAVSLFLFLFASLYRSRNSTCASTPELYVRNRKRKVEKKNDRSFVYSIVFVYIYTYIYTKYSSDIWTKRFIYFVENILDTDVIRSDDAMR